MLIVMVTSAVVFSSFTTPKESEEVTCMVVSPEQSCKTVGNCSVDLIWDNASNGYKVRATNYNDYGVNVSWTVVGYDSNGNKRQVGSGTLYCGTTGNDKTQYSYNIKTNCEDVGLGNVRVTKCD